MTIDLYNKKLARAQEARKAICDARRIVIKVGTSTISYNNGKLNFRRIAKLVQILCDLENSGKELVLVSSGAIAVGLGKLGMTKRPDDISTKQALAAIGQCELMFIYDKFFGEYNRNVAQVLLTADVIDDPDSRQNVVNTFESLLDFGVIPIVNENDTVATDELEGHNIGDNDTLSALVGKLSGADALIIISDVDGLYDSNPTENPEARMLPFVDNISPDIEAMAGGKGSALGTGGMTSKINAAKIATEAGFPCLLMSGEQPDDLYRIFDGKMIGTVFAVPSDDF